MVETAAPAARGAAIAKRPRMRTTIPNNVISSTPFLDRSRGEAPSFRCEIYSGRGNGARITSGILTESRRGFNPHPGPLSGFGADFVFLENGAIPPLSSIIGGTAPSPL